MSYGGPRGGGRFLMSEVPLYTWLFEQGEVGRRVAPVRADGRVLPFHMTQCIN